MRRSLSQITIITYLNVQFVTFKTLNIIQLVPLRLAVKGKPVEKRGRKVTGLRALRE